MKKKIFTVLAVLLITIFAGTANANDNQPYYISGVIYEVPTESFTVEQTGKGNPLQKIAAQIPICTFHSLLENNDQVKMVDNFSLMTSLGEPFEISNRRVLPFIDEANSLDTSRWLGTTFTGNINSGDGETFFLDYSFARHDSDKELKSNQPIKILSNVSASNTTLKTDFVRVVNGFAQTNGKTRYLALFVNK